MNIVIIIMLILLNGVFAMSELALVTARKSRLQRLAEDGDRSAVIALRLGEEPIQLLSTVQVGITAIGILNGIVGEAAIAGPLAEMLHGFGLEQKSSSAISTAVVVLSITYFTIVIGELVPKRIAQLNAEGIARLMARPIALVARLSQPFVYLLSISTDGILRLIGNKELSSENLTEEDFHAMLVQASQEGIIEKEEHAMMRNVFRLDDRQIVSLMTPRSDIVSFDLEHPLEENLEAIVASEHTYYPVCRGGMDNVLGVISSTRLLNQYVKGKSPERITGHLLPVVYVPESMMGMKLLEQFRESGVHMVFVVDEFGDILGLITEKNFLEALAGEFKTYGQEDFWAVHRKDGSWLFDGLIPIQEFKDQLELKDLPKESEGIFHTLNGMMMWLIGKVPNAGDFAICQDWRLEVVDLEDNRIEKVIASRLPKSTGEPENSDSPNG